MAAGPGRDLLGPGLVHGKRADQVDHLSGLLPATAAALVDGAGAPDPGSPVRRRGSPPTGGLDDLEGASHPPPVGAVGAEMAGTSFHGRSLNVWCRPGWLSLTVNRPVDAPTADPLGGAPLGAPWRRR